MIKIKIGAVNRQFETARDFDENWIVNQVQGLRRDNEEVCVHVTIDEAGLNLVLATPACGGSGGGGRPPTNEEEKIFDVWRDERLNSDNITGGNLIAFFKRIRKFL